MRKQRYMIYDIATKRYLREATRPGDSAVGIVTTWTRNEERALKLPGIKSAREMVRRLGVDRLAIVNGKKDIVG